MKKREKYKVLNYAKRQYSEVFGLDFQFKHLSKKLLYELLNKHNQSCMCIWQYCCYGAYKNCWQDLFKEGVWGMNQRQVNKVIKDVINKTAKACRKDNRILYCKTDDITKVIIIARDIYTEDYLITFVSKE